MPIVVTEPSGPCWTFGRSSPRLSKGIASRSAIYSPCCSRQPSRSLGHLLGSDGWIAISQSAQNQQNPHRRLTVLQLDAKGKVEAYRAKVRLSFKVER